MNEFILLADTESIAQYSHTLCSQRRLIKTDKTERFATALETEPQGCRHSLNTIIH